MNDIFIRAIIIFAATAFCVRADVLEHPILQEANRLALAGAADEAVTEYKRYLFFNPDSPAVSVYLSMAEAYRDQGRLGDAQDALRSALPSAGSDSVRDAIRTEYSVLRHGAREVPFCKDGTPSRRFIFKDPDGAQPRHSFSLLGRLHDRCLG